MHSSNTWTVEQAPSSYFLWTELRFVVRFVTPHIAIKPASRHARREQERYVGPTWFLTSKREQDLGISEPQGLAFKLTGYFSMVYKIAKTALGASSAPGLRELEHTIQGITEDNIANTRRTAFYTKLPFATQAYESEYSHESAKLQSNREILASWMPLLESLNTVYASLSKLVNQTHGIDMVQAQLGSPEAYGHVSSEATSLPPGRRNKSPGLTAFTKKTQDRSTSQTHVAVSMRCWTWDSLPADIHLRHRWRHRP